MIQMELLEEILVFAPILFALRNEQGDLLYAQGARIADTINVEAETMAILQVVLHCNKSSYSKVVIQTNSLFVQKILLRELRYPWDLSVYIDQIWELLNNRQVQIQHIMREGNQLADHLINQAIDKGDLTITMFKQLEVTGKKILNNDKMQCLYIRVTPTKG